MDTSEAVTCMSLYTVAKVVLSVQVLSN